MRPRKAGWLAVKEIQERPGCRGSTPAESITGRCLLMIADTLILPLVEFVVRWRICNVAIPLSPAKKWKMRRYGWKRVRTEDYDDSESALSRVSAQPVEILLCHNCHRSFHEPSVQMELDLDAYPICRVVVTNVTIQPWAFHRKFLTIRSFQ